ncbi:DUF1080 domain-containing protein [Bacteroidota bacterium]
MRIKGFLLFILFLSGCHFDKWIPLFNGSDLTGWSIKATPGDLTKEFWMVKEGCIEANSLGIPDHDYVWLMTEKEYGDFELKFRFQAFRDSPGNSGIQVRSRYATDEYWLNGPQIDIHPPGSWRSGMMWDETRGNQRWIFPDLPDGEWVDQEMALSEHEFYYSDDEPAWNEMIVRAEGAHIYAELNGKPITDFHGQGILDDENHIKLNVGLSGYIALQIHSGDELRIRYKDIFVRELE